MDVVALPIPPYLRNKLQSAGYNTLSSNVSPLQLARDACISHEDALDIIKLLPSYRSSSSGVSSTVALYGGKTAWELLCAENSRKRIVTSSDQFDQVLGGGICPREVTEVCGVPGVGKTQLGIQLAVNVQIPPEFGGLGGHAVYIDTEGSFMVERAVQIAEGCIAELRAKAAQDPLLDAVKDKFNVELCLSHIYYFRIFDSTEQIAVMNSLECFLAEHGEVRLVVIDSITFHFRQDFEDMASRTRILSATAQKLMGIAEKHNLAVFLVNQVTHKITNEGSKIVPALGESWSHACTNRIMLYWENGKRHALLLKSPSLQAASAVYDVTAEGIRDVEESNKRPRFATT